MAWPRHRARVHSLPRGSDKRLHCRAVSYGLPRTQVIPEGLGPVRDRPVREPHRGGLRNDPGYVAVQQILGIGPILGAVFVAEDGDVARFGNAAQGIGHPD